MKNFVKIPPFRNKSKIIAMITVLSISVFLPVNTILAQTTIVEWNFPNNPDDATADGGLLQILQKLLHP